MTSARLARKMREWRLYRTRPFATKGSVRVIAVGLSDLRNQAVPARASKFFVHAPRCDVAATQPLHRQEAERALGAIARFRHRDMPALTASCHQVHGRTGTVRPFANR